MSVTTPWGLVEDVREPSGPRMKNEPELMGAKEAAAELGVQQPNLRAIVDLPEPYGHVAASTLWRASDIRRLAAERAARKAAA